MTRQLRYGVIGCGRVFQTYHLLCLRNRPEFTVAAACDVDQARARSLFDGTGFDPYVTADLADFFRVGHLDAVSVCTPNDAHVEPVLAALDAGVAVLCEKPLAATPAGTGRLVDAAAGARLAAVNLPYRHHSLLPAFLGALLPGACDLTLTFTTAGQRLWRPATAWYADAARAGGGALLDLGPHAIDLLTTLFGPAQATGCRIERPGGVPGGVEESAEASLRVDRGPVRVLINRASRSLRLDLEARQGDRVVTLDLKRGEVHTGDGVVATARGTRPELAAIELFLDRVAGGDGAVAGFAEAAESQATIHELYALADRSPSLTR
ncbi:Gfo/Idh/MocA family protein [Actinoplanes derwentensis]|uniref:Predicted dehydrogenase n=1 Tax=Actinoplanes derwentensis TaxID=113562 RepID=A0A1H2DEW7_9ACTN|nr:Gfo/Idh/MocA family oxidoreductase [Actinoplanes derwentensis]GID90096.1 oxidoreductase [Actinoplanes derwentensis]SDT80776.1 Predicted dehydrogenase [Actinoplanes derwentensis]